MRLTLTKKELASEVGETLRDYLWWIAEDGYVSDEEIIHMRGWLNEAKGVAHIAAFHYLKELVDEVLKDEVIDESERTEIHRAILRVLPKDYRGYASDRKKALETEKRLSAAAEHGRQAAFKAKKSNAATDRQISYLNDLGGTVTSGMTKSEASIMISELTKRRATVRQQMVLRFWGKSSMANKSVEEVSDWMDAWYDNDPRRLLAWEMWKDEVGDYGIRDIAYIDKVPENGGKTFLKKVEKISKNGAYAKLNDSDAKEIGGVYSMICFLVVLFFLFKGCID